jgi:FtsP/CotA-like multicopper oxidase with cupredoxin domain
MRAMNKKFSSGRVVASLAAAIGSLLAIGSHAAVPGIAGAPSTPTFNLSAGETRINQPDGVRVYSWGYGCSSAPDHFLPAAMAAASTCPSVQLPGPTLIVKEGDTVTVNLTNALPAAAGNTSIYFPGFDVTSTNGHPGVLVQEAVNAAACNATLNPGCNTVTYSFVATTPGTHSYYSGTQGAVQIEMGLWGALVVLPNTVPAACANTVNDSARAANGEADFRLAKSAYDHASTCYDREYLAQLSEMDIKVHDQAADQVAANAACTSETGCLNIITEPYEPTYYMVNSRSFPDDADSNYAAAYPNQPYNMNPHVHPGENLLLRVVGQGRMQHPFHEHGNHLRVLGRDGNLLVAPNDATKLAGPLAFTTASVPGMAIDSMFYWTGKGLNWDVYGHGYAGDTSACVPDANGYYTSNPAAPNFYEWCGDHNKALEKNPFGQVAAGGPMTLPDPNIVTNGAWYSGSAYFSGDANARATGATPLPPFGVILNSNSVSSYAFMWHSHDEREITTANIFPGGMMSMLLVDPRFTLGAPFLIDESL